MRKRLSVISMLSLFWLLLSGFTLQPKQDGQMFYGDVSLVGEDVVNTVNTRAMELKDRLGVDVITYIDPTYKESDLKEGVTELLNNWKPSKTVVLVINPTDSVVDVGASADIANSITHLSTYRDRVQSFLDQGQGPVGISDFYDGMGYSTIEVDESVNLEEYTYSSKVVSGPQTINDFDTSMVGSLNLVDLVIIGLVVLVVLGAIVFGFKKYSDHQRLLSDIRLFREFVRANPQYNRKDIWEQLEEDGQIKHSYRDYKRYMANNVGKDSSNQNK